MQHSDMRVKHRDEFKTVGHVEASVFDMTSPVAREIEAEIVAHISKRSITDPQLYRLRYLELISKLRRLALVRNYEVANLVTTVGRSVLAQRLANTTTYTGIINYGALGSSLTTPVNADTQLGTEVFRKLTASTSFTNNVAFVDFFYTKADTNGTYNEFGTFIDGAAGANTGQMFNHALTGGWVKTSTESMTVSCTFTLS